MHEDNQKISYSILPYYVFLNLFEVYCRINPVSSICMYENSCVGVVGGCHRRGFYKNARSDLFKDKAVKLFKSLLQVK